MSHSKYIIPLELAVARNTHTGTLYGTVRDTHVGFYRVSTDIENRHQNIVLKASVEILQPDKVGEYHSNSLPPSHKTRYAMKNRNNFKDKPSIVIPKDTIRQRIDLALKSHLVISNITDYPELLDELEGLLK